MSTATKYSIEEDVKPRIIYSAYANAPFDKGKEALEAEDYRIISLEENARLRMQEGKNSFISRNGNWTREGIIYVPKKGIYLTKISPIMANSREATNCHRNGEEYCLTKDLVEEALTDSVELNQRGIPTNRFKDDKVTIYAFGDFAEEYGQFLRDYGIKEMPIWLADIGNKAFARQMWFRDLGCRSELDGYDRDLEYYWVRGVRIVQDLKRDLGNLESLTKNL